LFLSFVVLHNAFVAIHAVAASVCFVAGLIILAPPIRILGNREKLLKVFAAAFPVFLISLYLAIAFGWGRWDNPLKIIFVSLIALDLFMVWRAFRALNVFKSKTAVWQIKFIGHVGFNIISLFAGFVIVLAIVLGVPNLACSHHWSSEHSGRNLWCQQS
jgi:uncharacterized membrane protein